MDDQTQTRIEEWVSRYAESAAALLSRAAVSQRRLWAAFDGWYDAKLVEEIAAHSADLTATGRIHIGGLAEHYVATVVADLRDTGVRIQKIPTQPARFGADMTSVYTRPAEQYRYDKSTDVEEGQARERALTRLDTLVESDLRTGARDAAQAQMLALDVNDFRRVIRPELAKTGTCGLCIAASTRIYHVANLLPMHPGCHCVPTPVDGEDDPGHQINTADLERLYADAGSTAAEDLRTTRYQVGEHGELGPVLYAGGTKLRTAAVVPGYDDLGVPTDRLQSTLTALEAAQTKWPLPWNETRIDQLRRAIAARD